jgi:hypothetical protein
VFEFSLSNPAEDTTYTFTFTNGTAGSGLHYHTQTVTVPALLRELSVPTTADTIDENNEDFSIASGTASATGTINDNDAPTSHDHSCFGYRRKSCCV